MIRVIDARLAMLTLLAAIAAAPTQLARAQSAGAAEDDWEFSIGPSFGLSKTLDFNGGTTVDLKNSTAGKIGAYYYITDQLSVGGSYAYGTGSFNAQVQPGAGSPVGGHVENGHLSSNSFMVNARYSFLDTAITPFGLVGLGYNWANTDIASGPPQVGCWWDPWWGYVCNGYQNTHHSSGVEYQIGAGLQFNFSEQIAVSAGYNETWIGFHNASGTPSFGSVDVLFVWRLSSG